MLAGEQRQMLIRALSAAYPSYEELGFFFANSSLGRRLADLSAPARLPLVLHHVLVRSEAEGWTAALVTAALLANPGNPELRSLVDSGLFDDLLVARAALDDPTGPVQELVPQAAALRDGAAQELQHVIRMVAAFQNPEPLATTLLELMGRVCCVEVVSASGRSSGTGFLVGPDLLLTNHHVLAAVIAGSISPTGVRCVFDYRVRPDGTVDHGVAVGLAQAWLLAASPPSAVDTQADPVELPAADELDYALVRLAASPGLTPVTGGTRRGWLDLLAPPPDVTVGTPLLIVQHPEGNPLKLAVDTNGVRAINANGTRMRYGVNVLDGSSGAPCLTVDMKLAALHHSGSKDRTVKRNEGVPVAAIAAHLRACGHATLLPA